MQTDFIVYRKSTIFFGKFGSGPAIILCLHGFGETGKSFEFLEKLLGNNYTLLCIDLPFHGKTLWYEKLKLEPKEFITIVDKILQLSGLKSDSSFFLLGYSMGGRIALALLQNIPNRIEEVVLIAPDGLHVNFWYWLGTQTWLGNKIFYSTMQQPVWFFTMADVASKLGLLGKSIIKFVHYYLDDKTERMLLYKRWTTMRNFKPQTKQIRKIVAENNIPVRFIFGSYDRIILSKRSDAIKKDQPTVKVTIIEAGHQLLKEKHAEEIAMQFSQ